MITGSPLKDKDLSNNPVVGTIGVVVAMFLLAAVWVIVAAVVSSIATGDIHALYPSNIFNGILRALSSHL